MTGTNEAEIEGWNGSRGKAWLARHEIVNGQIEPFGRRVMAKLAVRPGERVFDIGCGCGEPSVELAAAVGSDGRVTGFDISALLLAEARALALRRRLDNIAFVEADAQTYGFAPGGADVIFSRFGVMFFADPTAAFRNIRTALRPGGRLGFVCWRTPAENRFITLPLAMAQRFSDQPAPRTDPEAPGPFAFADAERVRAILADAGFAAVAIEPADEAMHGGSLEDTIALFTRTEIFENILRKADDDTRRAIDVAFREALAPFVTPEGIVTTAGAWIVTAANP